MSSASVAIELLSEHMDVATVKGGRIVACRRIPLDLPSDATSWAKSVRNCGEKLQQAVKELDAEGGKVRLVYRSPTQSVDLASFEFRSAEQACAAAKLPAAQALRYNVNAAIIEAVAVGRDRSGPERRWHVIVAADRIDVVRALVEMVESAGLTFESATPMDAAIMAGLVDRALQFAGPQHGWLHFGNHSSFFILGGEGRVRFERSIALGTETIVQSLTRPIRIPDEDPIELDYDTAKAILHKHGIPENEDVLDESRQLSRRHIMPQIQPVLQRYVVELRQSLRFGLPEEERDSIEITVGGPGSALPGITELVAWELKLNFAADSQYAEYDYSRPAGPGSELVDAIQDRGFLDCMNILPPEAAQRRTMARLRRWLWIGAAAAVAIVGFDGLRLQGKVSGARREAAALKAAVTELQSLEKTHKRLVAAIGAMNELEAAISAEMGTRANLRAVLQELTLLTPASVRLNSMRFASEDGRLVGHLYGRAAQVDEETGRTELEPFIEAIKQSPVFRTAVLRNVEVGGIEGGQGQRFEATLEAVATPEISTMPELAAGGEETR